MADLVHHDLRSLPMAAILVLLALCNRSGAAAQVEEPLESPLAMISQVVGTKAISITFHSPGVKDRKIWGELVPYGQNWRAGANAKTTFEFSDDVVIGGVELAAGVYGFYILPVSGEEWQLVWNRSSVGSPNEFDPDEDVARVTVLPETAPFRERLLYSIESFSDWPPFTAKLVLHWETQRVSVPVEVKSAFEAPE